MTAQDVTRDPLYDPLRELVGEEHAMELLSRLPPPGSGPATRQDMRDVAGRMDGLEQRMDGLEQRMDGLEQRMDGLEQRMDGLEQRMGTFEERLVRQMDRFDDKLDGFHVGLREQTRNVMLANAVMMLTLATILIAVGVVT